MECKVTCGNDDMGKENVFEVNIHVYMYDPSI